MMTEEQARDIKDSMMWSHVKAEIDYRISCLLNKLRSVDTQRLLEVQKELETLESFKKLPEDVIDRESAAD